jgi:hypothetical protein
VAALSEILCLAILSEVPLPGTQPNELTLPPEPSSSCGCHDSFAPGTISEPGESYRATMMALSARDPLFRAALGVSFADRPELTDLCIRCHAPLAWLNGRSEPADGSLIQFEDLESVTCDMCHRMVPADPQLVGDGQYTLSPATAKRAPRGAAPIGGHMVVQDSYVSSSEMCGVCHSLFNPAEQAHDANAVASQGNYYEQRTYEEWVDSVFPGQGTTCITCHLSRVEGAAVRDGAPYSDLAVHNIVGGNLFAIEAVNFLYPNLAIAGLIPQMERWIEASLASSAQLEITATDPATLMIEGGDSFTLEVRLTNKTGHKLPTGYPEGRRVFLQVELDLEGQPPRILSGDWDPVSGTVVRDDQIRTYETEHGRVENGVGERTHHLILMNQIITDTRLPPEGFMPTYSDMIPQGRDYGAAAPYRHWDDHTYTFVAPAVQSTLTGTITVRAMYQSTDGDVIAFLTGATQGTPVANDLMAAWEALDHAPPQPMVSAMVPITIEPKPIEPDAGMTSADAGGFVIEDGGCSCVAQQSMPDDFTPCWWIALAFGLHMLRGRSMHHGIQTSRSTLSKRRA